MSEYYHTMEMEITNNVIYPYVHRSIRCAICTLRVGLPKRKAEHSQMLNMFNSLPCPPRLAKFIKDEVAKLATEKSHD